MRNILVLINRNFLILYKNIITSLFLYFLFPLFTYLIIVSPLSNVFTMLMKSGMSYTYHSVPALIFVCTSMLSLFIPMTIIKRDKKNNLLPYILATTVDYNMYFLSIMIFTVICAFFEFIISMFLAIQLSDSGSLLGLIISFNQIFYFSIAILPAIFLFATLGLLLSNFFIKSETMVLILFFFFLIISFGSATFIPIDYYNESFSLVIEKYNIINHLYNMLISILKNSNVKIGTIIISLIISIFFYFLNIIIFLKTDNIK